MVLIEVFSPCLNSYTEFRFKRSHYKRLKRHLIVSASPENWQSYWQDHSGLRFRLTSDPEYQLCSIDFLDYSKKNVEGPSNFPITLLLIGYGTFNHPYRIDSKDTLGLSLIRLNPDLLSKHLPLLQKNLNSQL